MNPELLRKLSAISPEEREILDGRTTIDRALYMDGAGNTISRHKLMSEGKLICIRPHTRFIHFPPHRHDYVEAVYMCAGQTTHYVNGKQIVLGQDELLFLNQSVLHEIDRAEETDIAVNFLILPDFFTTAFSVIGEEQTPLRQFLVDCLCEQNTGPGYLHFQINRQPAAQNLVENLLWTLTSETPCRRRVLQMTMDLLLVQLLECPQKLVSADQEQSAVFQVLRDVETNYRDGSLEQLAERLHYDISWLSRQIKRQSGKTYTQLIQERRLSQARFLLQTTDASVEKIALAVGYENGSYFHRLFSAACGQSPGAYRRAARKDRVFQK